MSQIASKGQLRWSFARWAAVCVPAVLLLGFAAGRAVVAGDDNPWYAALTKPALTPPGWAFPVAWTIIYICMGLAIATVLNARGARGRGLAVAAFAVLLAMLLAWTPLFFGARRLTEATVLIVAIELVGIGVALLFGRIRARAAWLLVPLLIWVGFASVLCWRIGQLNPDAGRLAPAGGTSQML